MEPKLLPLVEPIGARYQSLSVDPKLVNAIAEKGEQQGEVYVYKRPAFKALASLGAGTARGLFNWLGNIYAVANGNLYKNWVFIGAVNNSGIYSFTACLGATPVLFLHNTTNAYTVTAADVVTAVVDADYPAAVMSGAVYLDGTVYVMTSTSNINGSVAAGNDPTNWDPLNLIKAQIEPTAAIYLAKQLVYVLALKTGYSEAFYDAGNATGSPLAPSQGAKMNYGCVDGATVRDLGGDLIWVANTGEGYPCVVHVSSLKVTVVSTPPVERILAGASGTFYSWNARVEGHRLYGVTSVGGNFTLVYDLTSQIWYQWTDVNGNYIPYAYSCQGAGNTVAFLHATSGVAATLDVATYKDTGDTAFQVAIYTPNFDGGTRLIKVLSHMTVIGDQVAGTTLTMAFSDNDYSTWSADYTFDMSQDRPIVSELGSFTKRAFRLFHQADQTLRLRAIELFVSAGVAP